jgi:hypothetical protein
MSFPLSLPFTLPGSELETPDESTLVPVAMGDDAVGLLLSQFRGKPRIEGILRALVDGVQDLDDGVLQVYVGRWIDAAEGVQLDELGTLLDLARSGWPDETYRRLLKAQILVLASDGEYSDVIAVLAAVGITAVHVEDVTVAAMHVSLDEPPPDDIDGGILFDLLERTRAGGVRLTFEFPTATADDAFTFADDTTTTVDAARGFGDATGADVGGYFEGLLASSGGA